MEGSFAKVPAFTGLSEVAIIYLHFFMFPHDWLCLISILCRDCTYTGSVAKGSGTMYVTLFVNMF